MSLNSELKKEHTFTWKIENLSLCTVEKGEFIKSPVFKAKSLYNTSWYMMLYPRGFKTFTEGSMGCFLSRCKRDGGPASINCEIEIRMMTTDGKMQQSHNSSHIFTKGEDWAWHQFVKKSINSSNTHACDNVSITCNIKSNVQKYFLRSENMSVTRFNLNQFSLKWIVKNLNSNHSEEIRFPSSETSQVEISVQVPEDDIKITIRKGKDFIESQSVVCRITLLDVDGGKHDSKHALHLFEMEDSSNENGSWEFPTFLKKSKLKSEKEKYLKNEYFELQVDIAVSNGAQSHSVEDIECSTFAEDISSDSSTSAVLEDFKRLYINKIQADVKLLVGDQTILAHKNILSIRSPVFLAMFNADMVETESGSVTIPDFEFETVNSLLEYMYTGSLEKIDYEIAKKLIVATDKYQVLLLKEKCAHFLKSVLSHANVCEVLVVADLVQHEVLKSATVSYIKEHSENIFFSEEWNYVLESNLRLATETVSKVSKLIGIYQKKTENG